MGVRTFRHVVEVQLHTRLEVAVVVKVGVCCPSFPLHFDVDSLPLMIAFPCLLPVRFGGVPESLDYPLQTMSGVKLVIVLHFKSDHIGCLIARPLVFDLLGDPFGIDSLCPESDKSRVPAIVRSSVVWIGFTPVLVCPAGYIVKGIVFDKYAVVAA